MAAAWPPAPRLADALRDGVPAARAAMLAATPHRFAGGAIFYERGEQPDHAALLDGVKRAALAAAADYLNAPAAARDAVADAAA